MKCRTLCTTAIALLLTLASTSVASTTWYVDGVNGNDSNDCKTRQTACKTIGHAISLASSGDTIGVGPATYKENLTIGLSLRIIGSAAITTIIDGGGIGTVVTISNTAQVTLLRLTIRGGGGVTGGGILNSGTLAISQSSVGGNSVYDCNVQGGGIFNQGTLTINNSTLSANKAAVSARCIGTGSAYGAGIYSSGTLAINNSTISGNTSYGNCILIHCYSFGGGIASFGATTISNSTITGNSAGSSGYGGGGGIYNKVTLQNTIVANSPSGGNCLGGTSNGYNLSSDNSCSFSNAGDLNNTDPKLGPLQNNGGPTQTQALLTGSPAIDAGNPNGCTDGNGHLLKTDQRGRPRPDKEDTGGCDIGAFEIQSD